jgi:uncharacterized protein with gpF-like domain
MPSISSKSGFTFSPLPTAEALAYIKAKGWKVGFDYRDVWREEHAAAFTVAKAMTMDVLRTIRAEVTCALEEWRPLAQFKKELQPRLEALGRWGGNEMVDPKTGETVLTQLGSPRRLRRIYRANLPIARAAGQ